MAKSSARIYTGPGMKGLKESFALCSSEEMKNRFLSHFSTFSFHLEMNYMFLIKSKQDTLLCVQEE